MQSVGGGSVEASLITQLEPQPVFVEPSKRVRGSVVGEGGWWLERRQKKRQGGEGLWKL